jgi:hypothetical protein
MKKIYLIFRRLHVPGEHHWQDRMVLLDPAFDDELEAKMIKIEYDEDVRKKMLSGCRLYDMSHEIIEFELKEK